MKNENLIVKKKIEIEGIDVLVSEANTTLEYIKCARVIISDSKIIFEGNNNFEYIFTSLYGSALVSVNDKEYLVHKHDVVYLTKGDSFSIRKSGDKKLKGLLFYAQADNSYESVMIKHKDIVPHIFGNGSCKREVWYMVVPETVKADRLLFGFGWSNEGGWTGWPPHEHGDSKEELYYFYDIPENGYAFQLLYEKGIGRDLKISAIESDEIAIIKRGFHPIVVLPGYIMKNVWVMASLEPIKYRNMEELNYEVKYLEE